MHQHVAKLTSLASLQVIYKIQVSKPDFQSIFLLLRRVKPAWARFLGDKHLITPNNSVDSEFVYSAQTRN